MIVYGTRAILLKSETIAEPCPNCNKAYTVQISVFQRYVHVFWIPFFPIGNTGVSQCSHCKQVLKLKHMPPDMRFNYDHLRKNYRPPIWTFSGIGIIILVVMGIFIHDKEKAKRLSEQVLSPKINDVYELKISDSVYTLFKVQKIVCDTVYFVPHKMQTNQLSGLSDLADKGDAGFDASVLKGFSKSALVDMNQKEKIEVYRFSRTVNSLSF